MWESNPAPFIYHIAVRPLSYHRSTDSASGQESRNREAGREELHIITDARPTPVFICGTARSGTTLLARLLDGHSSLAVLPSETYFYRLLVDRRPTWLLVNAAELFGLHWLKATLARHPITLLAFQGRRSLRKILRQWARSLPRGDAVTDELLEEAVAQCKSRNQYWHAFLTVYQTAQPGALDEKLHWVEKTPSNERFVAFSERTLSRNTRYLHLLRDPRDVVASWILRRGVEGAARETTLVHVCYTWSISLAAGIINLRKCGERYRMVKYDQLVRSTREAMAGVSDFLGIDPEESLLVPTQLGNPMPTNTSFPDVAPSPGTVVASQVNSYKRVLSNDEVVLVERLLGAQMAACGYSTTMAQSNTGGPISRHLSRATRAHPPSIVKLLKLKSTERAFPGNGQH